ncbi:MAG TPA: hypothetical protein VFV78_05100 [Vicinamibacterales bacterium]|nr:hypothetical protein [Vicinamibacterales bacterium]
MKAVLLFCLLMTAAMPPQAATDDTRGIYDAVLAAVFKHVREEVPTSFIVADYKRPVVPPTEWAWQRLGAPAELKAKAAQLPAWRVPTKEEPPNIQPHRREDFPAGTQFASIDELRPLMSVAPPRGTNPIEAKYHVRWLIDLSAPLVTEAGLDALVQFGYGCGDLCGAGGYAWLHRPTRTTPWTVQLVVTIVS